MWPFNACLVAPGPTQAIFPMISLGCVFGFKPPESVMSVLLHLGAEVYASGSAPFALKTLCKQEAYCSLVIEHFKCCISTVIS